MAVQVAVVESDRGKGIHPTFNIEPTSGDVGSSDSSGHPIRGAFTDDLKKETAMNKDIVIGDFVGNLLRY